MSYSIGTFVKHNDGLYKFSEKPSLGAITFYPEFSATLKSTHSDTFR